MERRNWRQRQASAVHLPTICEYTEFGSEEDYQRVESNSKLMKTRLKRNSRSKRTQRFEDNKDPEEEQPLLTKRTGDNKILDKELKPKVEEEQKPKVAKGWKMQKRRVKTAWAKTNRCRRALRSSLGSSLKVLRSPLFLLKRMRDGYVRVMNRLASKGNQGIWDALSARSL